MVGGRRPLVEDNLWWKTTSVGRRPLVEDDLWWKTTFSGRRLSVEDDLRWKVTMVEDDLRWKTTFGGRRLLVEDDPCMLPSPLCGIFYPVNWIFWVFSCTLFGFVSTQILNLRESNDFENISKIYKDFGFSLKGGVWVFPNVVKKLQDHITLNSCIWVGLIQTEYSSVEPTLCFAICSLFLKCCTVSYCARLSV